MEGSTTLDQITSRFRLNDDAAFGGVTGAASSVNEKSRATAHVVRAGWVQIVAIRHALECVHVSKSVGALRKGSNALLALARRVVAA